MTNRPAAGTGAAAVKCDELVWGYDRPVARPLNVRVERGRRLGVYGSNGAGKSSLLAAILGRARIHSGTLCVSARPVAYHPQIPLRLEQMPWTGRDVLDVLGAPVTAVPEAFSSVLDQRMDRLSGGQIQLIGIIGVLAGPASLVLLDEPTSYLDPVITDAIGESIRCLAAEKTVVVVSHDRAFLERTCTDLIQIVGLPPEPMSDD